MFVAFYCAEHKLLTVLTTYHVPYNRTLIAPAHQRDEHRADVLEALKSHERKLQRIGTAQPITTVVITLLSFL